MSVLARIVSRHARPGMNSRMRGTGWWLPTQCGSLMQSRLLLMHRGRLRLRRTGCLCWIGRNLGRDRTRCRFDGGLICRLNALSAAAISFPHDAEKEVPAFAAAILGDGGKLLPVPLDDHPRSDRERTLHPNACPGLRCVFERAGCTKGLAARILPADFSDRPHHLPRLDIAPVHAICIGRTAAEFSYPQ